MTEAYKMLALISLANNDEISESIEYLQNAVKIQPQNYRLEYNLAQLFLRRKDFEMARKTALGLNKTCVEKDFCGRVREFINALDSIEQKEKELAELRKKYGLEDVDFEAENLLAARRSDESRSESFVAKTGNRRKKICWQSDGNRLRQNRCV